jgi:hypothetical protein
LPVGIGQYQRISHPQGNIVELDNYWVFHTTLPSLSFAVSIDIMSYILLAFQEIMEI